jgi:hypothetical protein
VIDALRSYLQLASGLAEVTAAKAKETATNLASQTADPAKAPEVLAEGLQTMAGDFVEQSRTNSEMIVGLVKTEVDRAVGRMGFVREEELAAVRRHVQRLETQIGSRSFQAVDAANAAVSVATDGAKTAAATAKLAANTAASTAATTAASAARSAEKVTGADVFPQASGGSPKAAPAAAPTRTPAKMTSAKKAASKKAASKKATPKKAAAKKSPPKKSSVKKPAVKKPAVKKPAVKKTTASTKASS